MPLFVRVDEKYSTRYRDDPVTELDQYIYHALDGEDHDRGALETVEATANNARRTLTRLVCKLVELRVLALKDVPVLLDSDDRLTEAQDPALKKGERP